MNVSDQIIAVIETLCEKFGIAIDWTSENIIPYIEQLCQRYITYEIATSAAVFIALLAMFVIALIVVRPLCKKANEDDWDEMYASCWFAIIAIVVTIGLGIATIVVGFIEGNDIITCLTFPEKQIFEYVSSLMSSG